MLKPILHLLPDPDSTLVLTKLAFESKIFILADEHSIMADKRRNRKEIYILSVKSCKYLYGYFFLKSFSVFLYVDKVMSSHPFIHHRPMHVH